MTDSDEPATPASLDDHQMTAEEKTTAVTTRESAVAAREETAARREGAASVREEAAEKRDSTALRRDDTAGIREEVADRRDDTATLRDDTVTLREEAARLREEAASLREEASTLREDAVQAREEAAGAKSDLVRLMTQLREANERLIVGTLRAQTMTEVAEEANLLKDEFLAAVSHELRTPLNAIVGWARILGSQTAPPDVAGHGIAAIERNAWAMAHIIDDLLDMSRIATGTFHMAAQRVDLVTVMQTALDTVRPLAMSKGVQLSFSALPATDTISGDAGRLEQVFWNLLANAIKFTPEGGRVDVAIVPGHDHMAITVTDTGQGISPDFLPHVFARFRQSDGATTGRHTGLGLGLSIVRQLVQLHSGTVEAASEGLGRGARFTVRLPISIVDPLAAINEKRTGPQPGPPGPGLDTLRILVVDGDADARTLTSLVLTQAGATVTAVASTQEALHRLAVERPDAILSEVTLPAEDGYELIRRIREDEAVHDGFLPAVALTGHARAEDRARILAAGFQAHVAKPAKPADLITAIATVIRDLPTSNP